MKHLNSNKSLLIPNSSSSRPLNAPLLVNIPAASKLMSMSPRWIQKRIKSGDLPSVLCGRSRRIDLRDIEIWIEKNKSNSVV